ncbi:ribosome small subunit-dependent GTPase A [Coralloluteibacterium stylophorae]|uniref:Small ribosomal subunit biogenesis GTPase RsgA n=1 Tax=Coralloluteibacterium stylophorae TaxID=1776034 RepID=A0A8J7VR69_9GAMM|nr:ribosome small subunit-dependent GTPase A [Coralloluteibacterium stylophorae]MBS7458253.1 ribosome small subunit-dependent GTPase A [Coralloluteibacterium stylophorae]
MHPASADLDRLRPLGWPDDAAARAALDAVEGARLARISEQHRSGYIACTEPGAGFPVQAPAPWLRPRWPAEERAVVGDWVTLAADDDQIVALVPRRSVLKRGAAGEHYRQQLIAANVDHVLVVCGLDGDFNPRRIERYLLVVRSGGAEPVVVLTKADRCADAAARIADLDDIRASGIAVHAVNAKDPATNDVLAPYLGPGRSAVLVGSSGAGKSTLTNTLLGRERMRTGEVRGTDSRGRHTTTHRALIPLPQGGCLIDTPGMREIKLSGEEDLAEGGFEDVEALAAACRFNDCAHGREPGCAVRAALEAGELDPGRYANYLKLRDELAAGAGQRAQRAAQRAEERVQGKALGRRPADRHGRR